MINKTEEYDDTELLANVRPSDWVNPTAAERYNLVVLGAGTAGLVAAAGAAGLGARVALVERGRMGGDCLNFGCVPSKALLRSARAMAHVREAARFGVVVDGVRLDFAAVMERMRRVRAELSPNDSAARFRGLGVDVFFGEGRFTGPDALAVAGQTLHFHRAVIATGAKAVIPAVPGLQEVEYLTNETVFSLKELPARLAVIGAGPIGCELAQAFARFGSKVYLIDLEPRILPREDPDAAEILAAALRRDGVAFYLARALRNVERRALDTVIVLADAASRPDAPEEILLVDKILVAVGRRPVVEGLGLEKAGVDYDGKKGVRVSDRLQTSSSRIFAAGDVCSRYQFTHAADALARVVLRNALFPLGRAKASTLTIPWCTYTDPEVAHVGMYEHEAKERGLAVRAFVQSFREVDRAVLDGDTEGFLRVLVEEGSDRIVGATLVAAHAGELINEVTVAMVGNVGLAKLANTIHPYPTQAAALKKMGDAYNRTRLHGLVKWLFSKWLAWTR